MNCKKPIFHPPYIKELDQITDSLLDDEVEMGVDNDDEEDVVKAKDNLEPEPETMLVEEKQAPE